MRIYFLVSYVYKKLRMDALASVGRHFRATQSHAVITERACLGSSDFL